ncbi:tetratricopeptide repeat protein [Azospirillum picis]|uniref:Tetratricopeptide (TPR) repeat protein/glycosyltransferase involved in cell wall biosynthesis n=1 Tax=Azospirillum picis TaxID=488438 RepID=A0ABU0MSQ7_9PROT|nr:tetratricopeptide repeat protein [Azospirillum picis]MBP2302746.1 tetratricopeptide (TPR) repeat protein/glycosyltransferase involved in cell wall biosynthesis [Azospirillum picis]MDQ0536497.1 tetratricopeptide (TPR) repeat protein/glycosyltransferase involved in cell wall biosynthesis [Azospirillum picis]
MTFSIAFIDPTRGDYTPDTPRRQPLGGSQSALCYLTERLADAGATVTLVNGTRTPEVVRGVRCVPMASMSLDTLCGFDVVILLNGCAPDLVSRLRAAPGERRLVLWTQHAADEPAMRGLEAPALRACWDGFAFVSRWQMETYHAAFGIEPARSVVLRNGTAPAFAGLFAADESVLATKPWPPVLAYTSAPFRGLSVLLDSLPRIRAALPGTRLRVFSSLEGYQVTADADPYRALYQRCRDTEGVEYVGALAQTDLADELRATTGLAYLNRFAETSCIAAMEAMAAGCVVVSSQLGALAETTDGFARLIPVPADPTEHALRFAEAVTDTFGSLHGDRPAWDRLLREQVDHATATMGWNGRARDWLDWLEDLRRRPAVRAAAPPILEDDASRSRVATAIAQSQTHLLDALNAHLNAGAQAGDGRIADPRWQAEARGLIALIEGSLRLDHNAEDRRSGVWATLRGYDAWLAHRTVLPTLPRVPVPPGGRRVFDCFQFHNELELLEVRLAELSGVVDRFVLVEATYTHAGDPKPLHYADNRARFAAYADKIIHVVVADDPGGFAWQREAHQREAIARALEGCDASDLIIVGDADEILRAPVVERLRHEIAGGDDLFAPQLDIFLYFLDLKSPEPWVSVAAAPWNLIRRIGPNRARYLAKQGIGKVVPDAGWHFTWMGGIERFRAKLESFAHREMIAGIDEAAEENLERLRRFYATGRFEGGPVPGMWTGLAPIPADAHPAAIRRRLAHFRQMGWLTPQPAPGRDDLLATARSHAAAGRPERSADAYRRAAALDPACIDAFDGLANLVDGLDALAPLRHCVVLDPWGNFHRFALAHACLIGSHHAEALEILLELAVREPQDHRVHGNLAVALRKVGRAAEAEAAGHRSLALHPAEPGALSNLGLALSDQSRHGEAVRVLRRAVALATGFPDARLNLALTLAALGEGEAAESWCRTVLDCQPDNALAHLTLATCLLRRGELGPGFAEYEWRTRLDDGSIGLRDPVTPPWRGEDPQGRTILLHDEQGLGDGIQFVRYAGTLNRLGARVVVACNDALVRLFATLDGVERVVGRSAPLPPHDAHAALMSLPHLLGTTLATVPAEVPYLRAEPELAERWGARLATLAGLRVGLVWAGNPDFGQDRQRSLPLPALLPLMEVEGVSFLGLQQGGGRRELNDWRDQLPPRFTDLGEEITDFADTAAILANLDLVISADTAVAHLAGALGRPVWTLLRDVGDWRWLDRGERTPWYPTMRLFRQDRPGSWDEVVADIRTALIRLQAGPAR